GSVYLASQTEPVRRQAALKLGKGAWAPRRSRPGAARQAPALMDLPRRRPGLRRRRHAERPAVLRDGGGQGVPITRDRDQRRPGLVVSVCRAVPPAHHKGVIHRDLEVIDFGLAKATEPEPTETSLADAGAVVGPLT